MNKNKLADFLKYSKYNDKIIWDEEREKEMFDEAFRHIVVCDIRNNGSIDKSTLEGVFRIIRTRTLEQVNEIDAKKFNDIFVENYEKDRKKIVKAMKGLKNVPYERLHLPIKLEYLGGKK